MKIVIVLLLAFAATTFTACSNSGVASRQQGINSVQGKVLENRSTRIQSRDERMWAAHDVWLQ